MPNENFTFNCGGKRNLMKNRTKEEKEPKDSTLGSFFFFWFCGFLKIGRKRFLIEIGVSKYFLSKRLSSDHSEASQSSVIVKLHDLPG